MVLALFLPAQHAQACAPSPQNSFYCCLPGFTLIGLHAGFALAILAAFIERPFVTRAGVRRGALFFAIQANLISLVVTGLAGVVVIDPPWSGHGDELMLGWMPAALALATLIEHAWLSRKRDADVPRLRWGWLLAGNMVSSAVVFAMPILRSLFETDTYAYIRAIQPSRALISVVTFAACAIVYSLAFTLAPKVAMRDRGRGFEVIVPSR